jgi:pre-mRNA-splicing factor 18
LRSNDIVPWRGDLTLRDPSSTLSQVQQVEPTKTNLLHPDKLIMDFASLMKSQIAASKTPSSGEGKKYLKRSEIEAQRQAAYQKEQEEAERARIERLEKKRKRDDEEAERKAEREEKKARLAIESKRIREEEEEAEDRARRKRLGLPELIKEKSENTDAGLEPGQEDIPDDELQSKLKEMGEPRILFGETHVQRLRRWRRLNEKLLAPKLSDGPIPTSLELLEEKDMKIPTALPSDATERKYLHRQLASYFDLVLREWQNALARRPREVKETFAGKQAANNFISARENLRPLFKKLENPKDLHDDILKAVMEVVHLAQLKRYVHANDAYLRLSIGKAAWPIGVTMVGIHERSAREKLNENENAAHIMSDEVTRKMLQGIKRCLSFAQTRWPPEDLGQLMG